jgi:beta-phosphoglucomutase-like phosphatase (HAD superfamily)
MTPRITPDAIIFDFDGVLLESEHAGNLHLADYLTTLGHPIAPEEAMARFTGLAGADFIGAVEGWAGRTLPKDFHVVRQAEHVRVMAEGLDPVVGAIAFVRSLPATLPLPARPTGSSPTWIIWESATHSATISSADASMSRAASRPRISICMRPMRSASRSNGPSSSRIRSSARPAPSRRGPP